MTTPAPPEAEPSCQAGATIPIPIVSALDFGSDPDAFYQLHAARPAIVRDCFPPDQPLLTLDLEAIETLLGDTPLHVYGAAAEAYREVPAKAVFDGVRGIGRGDLLYFPAGWIHEVATHEISYGVGGSVLNDYQIEAHMQCWLRERDMDFQGSLDLQQGIENMPAHRFSGPAAKARAEAALQMCRRWKKTAP